MTDYPKLNITQNYNLMNSKVEYVVQSFESIKNSIMSMMAGKVIVNCCSSSIRYFNKNLLTPAEFLNSVELHNFQFNVNLREENYFVQSCDLSLNFIDLEEYDNFTKKYYRACLINSINENSPSKEILHQLEKVN